MRTTDGVVGAFYEPLGYSGYNQGVVIALNYQGLGLPYYLYNQVINLIYRTNELTYADLNCDVTSNSTTCLL